VWRCQPVLCMIASRVALPARAIIAITAAFLLLRSAGLAGPFLPRGGLATLAGVWVSPDFAAFFGVAIIAAVAARVPVSV